MSRNDTVFDAQAAFARHPAPEQAQLAVIIVTEHGRGSEAPLGLITPWDLLTSVPNGLSRA